MEFGTRAKLSSAIKKEASLAFEVFELVQEEPPQLWRRDKKPRQDVHLTPLEARLLVYLAQRPGRWLTVQALADEVWDDPETGSNAIQVAVSRLRKKLNGFEHLIESGASKYRFNAQVSLAKEPLAQRASSLTSAGRMNLNKLHDCMNATEEILQESRPSQITIEHLGLDMDRAGYHLAEMVKNLCVKDVEYRLLVITDDHTKLPRNAPPEVIGMTKKVRRAIPELEKKLQKLNGLRKKTDWKIRVIIKQYEEVPIHHGWTIKQGPRAWFVSTCRWILRGTQWEYDWGGSEYYHMRTSYKNPEPSVATDICHLFDDSFAYLWEQQIKIYKEILIRGPGR